MASPSRSSNNSSSSPCAACKFLRRKCISGCVFGPYFPPEEPNKFINVHRIFGASNVSKILNEVLPHQREDTVNSLAYEAEARLKDPVYGCVGAISLLQTQVFMLQKELEATNADIIRYASTVQHHHHHHLNNPSSSSIIHHQQYYHQHQGGGGVGWPSNYYTHEGDGPCESGDGSL